MAVAGAVGAGEGDEDGFGVRAGSSELPHQVAVFFDMRGRAAKFAREFAGGAFQCGWAVVFVVAARATPLAAAPGRAEAALMLVPGAAVYALEWLVSW